MKFSSLLAIIPCVRGRRTGTAKNTARPAWHIVRIPMRRTRRIHACNECIRRHRTRRTSASTRRIPICRTSDTGGPRLVADCSSNPDSRIPAGYGASPHHAYPAPPARDVKARSYLFRMWPRTSRTTIGAHPTANNPLGRRYPPDRPLFFSNLSHP